ncbi:MAG: hypothetical protein AAGH15_20380 [Myxococcota bacterium]
MTPRSLPLRFLLALLACLSVAADGESCSAEVEDAGDADDWPFGALPRESVNPEPLSCELLDAGTCWTDMVAAARRCVPDEVGVFDADRRTCRFSDGTTIEWNGDVEEPDAGGTSVPFIEHRILRPNGEPCFTNRFLGVANVAYDVEGAVAILRADTLTSFTLVCPDDTTFANDVEGTCGDTGARWLVGGLPGYDVVCDGDLGLCNHTINGGPTGRRETLASCRF